MRRWVTWAARALGLAGLDPARLGHVDGRALCRLDRDGLARLVPAPHADALFAHLSRLRQGTYLRHRAPPLELTLLPGPALAPLTWPPPL